MRGFGFSIAAEAVCETSIGAAIGVHHQDHSPGTVQPDGLANLLQHKLAVGLVLRRGKAFGAAGNFDGIGIHHADALEEFSESKVKPIVEAPENSSVAVILLAGSVEVKNFFHKDPFVRADRSSIYAICNRGVEYPSLGAHNSPSVYALKLKSLPRRPRGYTGKAGLSLSGLGSFADRPALPFFARAR